MAGIYELTWQLLFGTPLPAAVAQRLLHKMGPHLRALSGYTL